MLTALYVVRNLEKLKGVHVTLRQAQGDTREGLK